MSNKTKEEIEQLAKYIYGTDIDSIRGSKHYDLEGDRKNGFIKGYTKCQETLTAHILELESQLAIKEGQLISMKQDISSVSESLLDVTKETVRLKQENESLTNKEVSCKEDEIKIEEENDDKIVTDFCDDHTPFWGVCATCGRY